MNRNLSPALLAGTTLALVLLVVNLAFTIDNVGRLRRDAVRIQHSNDVIRSLQGALSLARGAEADQRSYLMTGRADDLERYRGATRGIARQVDNLEVLVRGDAARQAQLQDLRSRLDGKLGELELAAAVRERSGFTAARDVMLLNAGKASGDALRASADAMANSERAARASREADAESSYRNAIVAGIVTGAAALLGVIAFVTLMVRYLAARDRSEAVLSAEAGKLRTTLGSIGDAVIVTDDGGRITSMNAAAEALTGWSERDSAGAELGSVFRVVDEVTRQPVASPLVPVLRDGQSVSLGQHKLLRKDAGERSIDDSVAPIRAPEGEIVGAVLVFRDVSERKQSERALLEAEARLRRVVMDMAVPTMAFADDGSVVLVNDAWVDGTGYRRDQLLTVADWAALAYPERAGFMRQHIDSLFALKARVDSGERQVTTASGDKRLWHFYTAPIGRDPSRRRLLVTNAIDVTERKVIEGRLRESESRLRFALDAAGVGQWELGGPGAQHSLRHDRLFGYDEPVADWNFERFMSHVAADDRARVEAAFREALAHAGALDVECRIRRVDGALRHLWIRASGRREPDGQVRLLGVVGDMTREKVAIEMLRGAGLEPMPAMRASAAAGADGGADDGLVAAPGDGLRVLVVEDNDDSAEAMVMLLELSGHDVHLARKGGEALAMAPALRPEAVLLDIGLPDMSGYEVCRRLREQAAAAADGPVPLIVAITGWAQERDNGQSRAAGFDSHLVKPVSLHDLSAVLARRR